jgi:hypothetical protein
VAVRRRRQDRGELYGRALVVFAAQHYATQLVLAGSKRRGSVLPRSHKDTARKAFARVTKGVLPASHTRLQRAIAAEARAYERSIAQLDSRERLDTPRCPTGEGVVDEHVGDAGPDPDDDLDMEDRGD